MKIEIDKLSMSILIDLLAREVSILRDESDYYFEMKRRDDNLLAEKAEIIKMLGQQIKAAPKKRGRPPKITSVITAPKKVGRPKGSKNDKSK